MNITRIVSGGIVAFAMAGSMVSAAPAFASDPITSQNSFANGNGGAAASLGICAVGDRTATAILPGLFGGIGIDNILYPVCATANDALGNGDAGSSQMASLFGAP